MITKTPIFGTGVPRCGSSWVGDVLSTTRRLRLNYEPFNPTRHPYLTRQHVYLAAGDDDPYIRRAADAAFAGKVRFHQFLRGLKWGYGWRTIRPVDRVLVKDPTAMFLAEWVAKNFKADVLVIVRHPCGFASSIHKLGWPADVAEFMTQPRLMEDWLGPYESLLRECQGDFWRRVAAFWGSAYTVLSGQLRRHREWKCVLYEDLCLDPRGQFDRLFEAFGLEPTAATRRILSRSTTTEDNRTKSTRRQSTMMADAWKKRLTKGQINTVMSVVREFDLPYYRDLERV